MYLFMYLLNFIYNNIMQLSCHDKHPLRNHCCSNCQLCHNIYLGTLFIPLENQLLFCGFNKKAVNVYNPDALLWAKYEG